MKLVNLVVSPNMKILQLLTLLSLLCGRVPAQSIDAELVHLREFLNIPASTAIIPSTAPLPSGPSLKVFIATGAEKDLSQVFVKSIDQWNKKNSAKFGRLEVVSDIATAQVVLAWYSIQIDKMTTDDRPLNERTCCPQRNYSYLLVRTPEGLQMLSRIIIEGYESPSERDRRGDKLRRELFKRMKAR